MNIYVYGVGYKSITGIHLHSLLKGFDIIDYRTVIIVVQT